MADNEKSWWQKAADAAERGTGALLGGAVGILGEIGDFTQQAFTKDSSVLQYFGKGTGQFRQFALGLEQMRKGELDITKQPDYEKQRRESEAWAKAHPAEAAEALKNAPKGSIVIPPDQKVEVLGVGQAETRNAVAPSKPTSDPFGGVPGRVSVLQGMFGANAPHGKQVSPKQQATQDAVEQEAKFKQTPFYDASKRDLLNLGEGLVNLAGLAVGFGEQEAYERARAEQKAKYPERKGPPDEFLTGMNVGVKTGSEIAGGALIPGVILGAGFTGKEGQTLRQEAPITYYSNLLPVLGRLSRAFKAGRLSAAQKAALAEELARTRNPLTGQAFSSLDELNKYVDEATTRAKTGQPPLAGDPTITTRAGVPVVDVSQLPSKAATLGYAAANALERVNKLGVGRVVEAGLGATETGLGKVAPYAAVGASLAGVPGAIVGAGVALAPHLNTFLRWASKGNVGVGRAKTSKAKRMVVEPRAYETEPTAQAGEELLTTAGEARSLETALGNLPDEIAAKARHYEQAPLQTPAGATPQQVFDLQQQYLSQNPPTQTLPVSSVQNVISEGGTITEGVSPQESRAGVYVGKPPSRFIQVPVDYDNNVLYQRFLNQLKGTALEPDAQKLFQLNQERQALEQAGKDTTAVLRQIQQVEAPARNLFTEIVSAKVNPYVSLIDASARKATIEALQNRLGFTFDADAAAMLDANFKQLGEMSRGGNVIDVNLREATQGLRGAAAVPQNLMSLPLGDFVNEGLAKSQVNPVKAVMTDYLTRYETGLKGKALRPAPFLPADADITTRRQLLQEEFTNKTDPASITSMEIAPEAALEAINAELVERYAEKPTQPNQPYSQATLIPQSELLNYRKFLLGLKQQVETFKKDQRTGLYTQPSLAELPQERAYDWTAPTEETTKLNDNVGKFVNLTKRLTTTYNPIVLVGNYVGNALVESLNPSSPFFSNPLTALTNQAQKSLRFALRVREQIGKGAQEGRRLSLTDDLALRATPREALTRIAETGEGGLLDVPPEIPVVKQGVQAGNIAANAVKKLYDLGDTIPKTAEALSVAEDVVRRVQETKVGGSVVARVGPELDVVIQRSGENTYTIINPKSGNIITSGNLDSSGVRRVLGAVVKSGVDAKFPDVSQQSGWHRGLMSGGKTAVGKVASMVVFQPFLSYVLKAADNPYKRGILGNTLLYDSSPIIFQYDPARPATSFMSRVAADGTRYAKSRGIINSMAARYNTLSAEEREALREFYANSPAELKPTIFGALYQMDDASTARNVISPSFATFWSMTDSYYRAIPGALNWIKNGIKPAEKAKALAELSAETEISKFDELEAQNKLPSLSDTFTAAGLNGGMLADFWIKTIGSKKLGQPDPDMGQLLRTMGLPGKIILMSAEKNGIIDPKNGFVKAEYAKDFPNAASLSIIDRIVGTQFANVVMPKEKTKFYVKELYNEFYNNAVVRMMKEADKLREAGEEDKADDLLDAAKDLNDKMIDYFKAKTENYSNTLKKIGVGWDYSEGDYTNIWKSVKEKPEAPVIQEEVKPQVEEPPLPFNEQPPPQMKFNPALQED